MRITDITDEGRPRVDEVRSAEPEKVQGDIDAVIEEHRSIIDWRENLDMQREMGRDSKRLLRGAGRYGEEDLDELVRQVVEVARRRPA